jgi:hypothetical protein
MAGTDESQHCKRWYQDLLTGSPYRAIEPDIRADSYDDPRLEKWRRCDKADERDIRDVRRAYLGLRQIGSTAFRYYRIEVDGNRDNGPEDVLYHEGRPSDPTGGNAYNWVDIEGCTYMGLASLAQTAAQGTNVLARYRGEVFAVEVSPFDLQLPDREKQPRLLIIHRLREEVDQPLACGWREE